MCDIAPMAHRVPRKRAATKGVWGTPTYTRRRVIRVQEGWRDVCSADIMTARQWSTSNRGTSKQAEPPGKCTHVRECGSKLTPVSRGEREREVPLSHSTGCREAFKHTA